MPGPAALTPDPPAADAPADARAGAGIAPAVDLGGMTLGFLATDVARLLRAGFEARVAEAGLGLTAGETRALVNIARAPGVRQSALAERMGVEPMTLCGYLDRLQRQGLVRRRPHPDDGRAKTVEPTEAGEEMLRRVAPVGAALLDDATAGLDAEARDALLRGLAHMRARLCDPRG